MSLLETLSALLLGWILAWMVLNLTGCVLHVGEPQSMQITTEMSCQPQGLLSTAAPPKVVMSCSTGSQVSKESEQTISLWSLVSDVFGSVLKILF